MAAWLTILNQLLSLRIVQYLLLLLTLLGLLYGVYVQIWIKPVLAVKTAQLQAASASLSQAVIIGDDQAARAERAITQATEQYNAAMKRVRELQKKPVRPDADATAAMEHMLEFALGLQEVAP